MHVEVAGRPQQSSKPAQLIPQRVCPFRNEQGPGCAQDGAQLPRGHAHLVQAFRFPSEPSAWVMRDQPSDMAREGPLHMLHHRRIRCRLWLRTRGYQRQRAKELGASVMIFGSRSTELPFEVGQCAVLPVHLFDFEFAKALKDRSVLHDGYVVERDVRDRGMVHVHTDAGSPDSQGRHRHELPLSEMN